MSTNTKYVSRMIRTGFCKQKTLKTTNEKVHMSQTFLKVQLFHRYFWRILLKYSRALTEKSIPFSDIYLKFLGNFCKIVIIFPGRNTNNKVSRCSKQRYYQSHEALLLKYIIMNLEQVSFTSKRWQLVLALFAS